MNSSATNNNDTASSFACQSRTLRLRVSALVRLLLFFRRTGLMGCVFIVNGMSYVATVANADAAATTHYFSIDSFTLADNTATFTLADFSTVNERGKT